jgi:hypothetical protein
MATFNAATYDDDNNLYLGIAKGLSSYSVSLTPRRSQTTDRKSLNDAQDN